ncbi:MAG: NAD-dependent epimerase/dehydratase family protein [Chloroflexi bacterium]|nr:NAD-dependent epimerase/dehydratase family protein [Chloroflexota bacterium]MCL5275236.1 NAD-dependent epimerase/dehydratase family protein [Chloroflexota bacterium]
MPTVLITGATGCVGANLVEAVTQHGWRARALRRATSSLRALDGLSYEPVIGDVTDCDSLVAAMRGVEIVFHAAAVADYWRSSLEQLYRVNVDGTRNVLRAAAACGVRRVVFTSSVAALGVPPFGHSANETSVYNLPPDRFHYGYSKALAEQIVLQFVADGLDAVIVNPAVVVGPRDVNLIGGSLLIEEKRIGIPVYPPGGMCVIDVADVCAGQIAAAEKGRRGERYILGGENLWHRNLIAQTAQIVGRRPARIAMSRGATHAIARLIDLMRRLGISTPANGDQMRLSAETMWFDSSKARAELGLVARPYRQAAQRAYDWLVAQDLA